MLRISVVGHVEVVDFVPLLRLPHAGEVMHATAGATRAAGGGGVAAGVLADQGVATDFFCALGTDAPAALTREQLAARGVEVFAAERELPTRRAVTLLLEGGERTIITLGERLAPVGADPLPWDRLAHSAGVYLTAGDRAAGLHARRAPVLVATPRAREALSDPGLVVDVLILSAQDADEVAWSEQVNAHVRVTMWTDGPHGGHWEGESRGRWAAETSGPARDTYGAGDSFAAGVTLGLARGLDLPAAAQLGARLGAHALTVAGAP